MRPGLRSSRGMIDALERRVMLAVFNERVIHIGGQTFDGGFATATDPSGNVVTAGLFGGTVDFDPSSVVKNLTSIGQTDIYVAKYTPAGALIWAGQIGGGAGKLQDGFPTVEQTLAETVNKTGPFPNGAGEYINSLHVGPDGSIYLTGCFSGTASFDPFSRNHKIHSSGFYDGFFEKLRPDGNISWVRSISGQFDELVKDLAIDPQGNVVLTGYFTRSTDFDPTSGARILNALGRQDIFVGKYTVNGTLRWIEQFGGDAIDLEQADSGEAVAIDKSGNIFVTGTFASKSEFDPGPAEFIMKSDGKTDTFLMRLASNGRLDWAKQEGGDSFDGGYRIAVGSDGNVVFGGYFSKDADVDPGSGTFIVTANPSHDIEGTETDLYFEKLSPAGNLLWLKTISGAGFEWLGQMQLDDANNIYYTGAFSGQTDFDPGRGVFNLHSVRGVERFDDNGSRKFSFDIFVSALSAGGNFRTAFSYGSTGDDYGIGINWDATNGVVNTGFYKDTTDFAQGTPVKKLRSNGLDDAYLLLIGEII